MRAVAAWAHTWSMATSKSHIGLAVPSIVSKISARGKEELTQSSMSGEDPAVYCSKPAFPRLAPLRVGFPWSHPQFSSSFEYRGRISTVSQRCMAWFARHGRRPARNGLLRYRSVLGSVDTRLSAGCGVDRTIGSVFCGTPGRESPPIACPMSRGGLR
jgi:hypothetical protein